jgi:hypothetical protein
VYLTYTKNTNICPVFSSLIKGDKIAYKRLSGRFVAKIMNYEFRRKYSGHSLRAGFCTQASVNGVSDTQGMRHSKHKHQDTWRKYVRLASVRQDNAATKLGL